MLWEVCGEMCVRGGVLCEEWSSVCEEWSATYV